MLAVFISLKTVIDMLCSLMTMLDHSSMAIDTYWIIFVHMGYHTYVIDVWNEMIQTHRLQKDETLSLASIGMLLRVYRYIKDRLNNLYP